MTNKVNRPMWLQKLVGEQNADALGEAAKEAQERLDKAGVARKEGEAEAPVTEAPAAEADPIGAAAVAVVAALKNAGVVIDDEAAAVIIVKDALTAQVAAEEPGADGEPVMEAAKALESGQLLIDYILSTTKDMGGIAQGQIQIADAVKALAAALPDEVKKLEGRIEQMEKQLKGRPRQASQDDDTLLPDSEEAKVLKAKLEKGLNGTTKVLGVVVSDEYAAAHKK